ncbi:hypothetical protein C2S52_005735 [Perilla frutescens var. hirtella]|nr:hypothetical protein C2S52_005735 [Perilla frutescens var. hirtella]
MADAAAVILSEIEKVDSWLLQKADHRNDYAKLCSLRLEKKDLVVGMMEVWENDNEMLYSLLVGVADLWDVEEEKVDNDKLYSFLGEMKDLWELTCWEKLHSFLLEMMDPDIGDEKLFSLAVGMADLWKDSRGKLNKEKLYCWLAMKTNLWEQDKLFDLLEGVTILDGLNEEDWKNVEGVRNDLRFMLDYFLNKLEDQGSSHGRLHYFMSDVVEMAHDVQVLIHVKDSDPFILFLQIVNLYLRRSTTYVAHAINFSGGFLDFFFEIKPIHECLEETEKRVRKFGEIKNVRDELVGPSPTYRESDHHLVGLKQKFGADETSQKNNVREELVGLKEDVELLLRNAETTIRILGLAGIGKRQLSPGATYKTHTPVHTQ